ncbi:sodium:solute symporter family protein [Streptomyces odontomachi]|uniref:sodium:solute symporter family protein n=1 Tax=Streptomyces odontomachi TaxID=2944940 RepID=UPI00210E8B69|nr:sodium:solute symporter family protein [Streptomyces sp. ODS25]
MSPLVLLLVGIGLTFVILVIGALAGRTKNDNLEGWLVHHRGMGPLLLWFLLGSEIYTAFTFQGLAGYSYTKGAAGFYNVAQNDVAYGLAFLILPCIWVLGKKYGYVTQADFVAHRYGSKALGVFVALSTALIMIAYIDLNIEGLSAIFKVIGGDAIPPLVGNVLGFAVLATSVFIGGIRGNAMQSVVKDLLMFGAVAAVFIAVPLHYFSGFGSMYGAFSEKIPDYFQLPSATAHDLGPTWLISTVLITGLGQWMWPQWFGTAFTATTPKALKKQAVFMPFYQIVKVAVLVVGFAAVIALGTGLAGNDVIMHIMQRIFPDWALLLFVVAGMLSAIVPAGPIVMTSASLLSRNVVQVLRPATTDRSVFWLTRALVFPLTGLALVITLAAPALIVQVLLVAYSFIAQLFPGIVIGGIFWTRATKQGMVSGLLAGWLVCGVLTLTDHDPYGGIAAGLIALVANVIVFVGVSLVTEPTGTTQPLGTTLSEIAAETTAETDRTTEPAPAAEVAQPSTT